MKRLLVCILLTAPILTYAQRKEDWYTVDASFTIPKKGGLVYGIHLSGNSEITRKYFLGLGLGAVKLSDEGGVYFPMLVKSTFIPKIESKISPYFLLDVGYAFYRSFHIETNDVEEVEIRTKGGPTFFGGLGTSFKKGYNILYFSVGYSYFGYKRQSRPDSRIYESIPYIKVHSQGLTLKTGIYIR